MAIYKLHYDPGVFKGKFFIPADGTNADWQAYLAWLDAGNTPDPADPEPPPDEGILAKQTVKQWYLDNPNASLLYELSIEDLETEITNQVNALFPNATAGQKNKEILFRMTVSLSLRVLVRREGLID